MTRTPLRRWAAGALGVLAALAGCDRATDPPAPTLDVTLTVQARQEAGALLIEYTLLNREQKAIVAFTGVPRSETHEPGNVDLDAVYVTARDDDKVEIAKRVFGLPKDLHPAVRFIVEGTIVPAGVSFGETVRVPLPLAARRPYVSDATLPAQVRQAVFCVGVATEGTVQPEPQSATLFTHSDPVAAAQQLICSDPFPVTP
ncbi:hypothetical protein [Luedemannella helvata]|uniref:Lipoprotein n=1 Tax=Luedemannella helvata TaxID=349315 RepID=A0ABN2KDT4_9ACTN